MKRAHQLIGALTLLAWFCAGAHVAFEHGGKGIGVPHGESGHGGHHHHHHPHDHDHDDDDDDDDGKPGPGEEGHHRHDLGASTQFTKHSERQFLAPHGLPLCDWLAPELTALLRHAEALNKRFFSTDPPLDARMSGWLFAVQTACPVRGPSLTA